MSAFHSILRKLWLDIKWYFRFTQESIVINYLRPFAFDGFGWCRTDIRNDWYLAATSMVETEIRTRNDIFDIVKYHRDIQVGKMKRSQWDDEHLKEVFTEWNEEQVLDLWDIFMALETENDPTEMRLSFPALFIALDNLNNGTGNMERMEFLSYSIPPKKFLNEAVTLEEFLYIMYDLLVLQKGKHPLAETFQDMLDDMKTIRCMSLFQQIQSGFF